MAMLAHWRREPPVEWLAAAYMGFKPRGQQGESTAAMHVQPRPGMHISEFDAHDRAILMRMSEQASELQSIFGRNGGTRGATAHEIADAIDRHAKR